MFNHVLAAHGPERGMFVYYTALQPSAYRVYSDPYDSMWCCIGTGLEVPGKYGQMIYTRARPPGARCPPVHRLRLEWSETGVTVRQDTRFPDEPATTLTLTCARPGTEFALRIRHPEWVTDGVSA